VPNVINLARKTPATHVLVVRHQDKPGVLAHVFDRLREAGINVQETENIIFADAEAAVARVNIEGAPSADVVAAIKSGNAFVLDVHLVEMTPPSA
jgi:D-3-phosphoglycerate dehydrogenase